MLCPLPLTARLSLDPRLVFSLLALVLLCGAHQSARAQNLKADYQFQNGSYGSTVPGPTAMVSLINPLPGGGAPNTFVPDNIDGRAWTSLRFPFNNGLRLTPTLGVIPNNTYSVVILFKFDDVAGWKRLLDVKNGTSDDGGAYLHDGYLNDMGPMIAPNTYVQIVGTRAADGTVVGYVDGVQIGLPLNDEGDGLIDANNTLRFFQDNFMDNEASAGNVARIRLYDGVLSPAQVAALDRLPSRSANLKFDYDGDGKSDISVFRSGNWYYQLSASSIIGGLAFGLPTDKLVPGDYDRDGQTDFAVFRNGDWYLQLSTGSFRAFSFGQSGDVPVPRDYDGDGFCDFAVFRQGVWYILQSGSGFLRVAQFGLSGDVPVPLDYDGDDKTDIAVFRNGIWYIQRSLLGYWAVQFGQSGDIPVPADYDGDNRTDFAIYRNGGWFLARTTAGPLGVLFGVPADRPVPADYDGDGKADIAIFRNGAWYIQRSSGSTLFMPFGQSGDVAVPAAYLP